MKQLLTLLFIISFGWHHSPVSAQSAQLKPVLDKARAFVNSGAADSAMVYADMAIQMARNEHDTASLIRASGIKGKCYVDQKKYTEAISYFFDALKVCKQPRDTKQMAFLYSEIAYVYLAQNHSKEAKEYYEKELTLRKTLSQDKEVGNAYINIVAACRHLKEYDTAFAMLRELRALTQATHDTTLEGYYYTNKGVVMQVTGQPDSAMECYRNAYRIWKIINKESEIFRVTFNIGALAAEKKNYAEALAYYHLSEAAAKKFGLQHEIANIYASIAEALAASGNYKEGYKYLHDYATVNDSLNKIDFNEYIVKLDKQFQTEKNKETIQEQQIKLNDANLQVQQQKTRVLIIVLILITLVFGGIAAFAYLNFKRRVTKQVEEAKNKFFENVAHEIRTPLSMIQGPVSVLQGKITDPELKEQLDMAERNTRRLNELFNQMLAISKIENAKYVLTESYGNLEEFTRTIAARYKTLAYEKQITVTEQYDGITEPLLFDRDALEKITGNLLENAIKYTPAGGATGIEVSTAEKNGLNQVTINIWDNGPGIPREEQEQIFNRFYRGANQKTNSKGIGIGLSLVKDLVLLMNGTITVESSPGAGTVFSVTLPLKKQQSPSVKTASPEHTSGFTLLLVEDDNDILQFNTRLLEKEGHSVLSATNGNEALLLLESQIPDLMVTDVMMPGMDGLTLLRKVKGNPATSHIPIIILSAKSSAQAKMEGLNEGAQAYLPKPFMPEELNALVKNLLHSGPKPAGQQIQEDISFAERFAQADPFSKKCYDIIYENLDDSQLSVEGLADLMFINRSHLQRKIKTLTGYSPSEMIKAVRMEKAKELLLKREGNITEIAYTTGFTSQSYFTKCFTEYFGMAPSQLLHNTGR